MKEFFIYLLKSSGLIITFWICFRLFLKRETFFEQHRIFLVSGIVMAILIPLYTLKKIILVAPQPIQTVNLHLSSTPFTLLEASSINGWKILFITYILGVVVLAFRFIVQLFSLRQLLKDCHTHKDGKYTMAITHTITSPFSFFNTIVYNPTMYDETALKAILIHEKIHADQKHSIDMLLAHFLNIFQWYNPVAWWYKKEMSQNLEYIADKNSTELLEDKKAYQYLLLHQSGQLVLKTTIINPFFNSLIKKRIVMLNQKKSKQINLLKFSFILPLLVAFVFLFNTKTIAQVKETTTQKGQQWSVGYGVATNAIEIAIDKNSTDAELDQKSADVKENHLIDLKFSKIKRNKKGEITALKSTYKTNNGKSGNYAIAKDEPIDPILFSIVTNEEGDITSIGYGQPSIANYVVPGTSINTQYDFTNKISATEVKKIKIKKSEENDIDEVEIIVGQQNDSIIVDEIEIPSQTIQIRGVGQAASNQTSYRIDEAVQPLYVLNGNVQENFNQNTIAPNEISSVNVIRGKDATDKYGKKAGYGVIEITSKNTTTNHNPLYLVDGKEKSNISTIDSNTIESVKVLTGEGATKKYGEKGKNGVVEISTKTKE